MPPPTSPVQQRRPPNTNRRGPRSKQALVMDDRDDPAQWLGFSLPPRSASGPAMAGPPRRSKRGDAWRGSPMTREKFVNASFRFMLKPTELASYGAHFADPDIALHWPNILQILVPTFTSFSVAQGFVSSGDDDDALEDAAGEEAAERRRRMEEEKQGRTCPICLSKPVAGRMTKCGHIFCFPCVLHFIQLSDVPKAASCPICGDTIHEGMLKSVRYLDSETMVRAARGQGEGDNTSVSGSELQKIITEAKNVDNRPTAIPGSHRIHMRLLERPQMTTLALPPTPTWPSDAIPPLTVPWYFLPDVLTYSHFMLATPEYMLSELHRELQELKGEWDLLDGDDLGRSFVTAARDKVERQILKVNNELMTPMVRRLEGESRAAWNEAVGAKQREEQRRLEREAKALERKEQAARESEVKDKDTEVPIEFLATSGGYAYSGPTVHVPANEVVAPNPMPPTKRNKKRSPGGGATHAAPPAPPTQAYWFYQSSLGANVYLSPLDSRMLLAHYESYAACPPTITITTTGYDSATVTEDLRKRVKYLSHLPIGAEVVFVEADLTSIVSKDVLAQFEQPLKARRTKRRDKVRREDRSKRRAEEAERARQPPEAYVVPSALTQSMDPDEQLAMALAASSLEAGIPISAEVGAAYPLPSAGGPGTSPPVAARSPPGPGPSFAWAVHSRSTTSNPIQRREHVEGVDEAWSALGPVDEEDEENRGKKKKGGKKGKKLVLGGGGARRA